MLRAPADEVTCEPRGNASPPAKPRRDVLKDRLDDVSVVVDPELIGNGEEECVCFGDGSPS